MTKKTFSGDVKTAALIRQTYETHFSQGLEGYLMCFFGEFFFFFQKYGGKREGADLVNEMILRKSV